VRRPLTWLSWSALVAIFAIATFTQADPDLWGHLRFGLDMLRTHTLPLVDPYSFTQDVPWINHEWLSEFIMAAGYRVMGVAGLALVKGTLVTAAFLLIWRAYRGAAFEARLVAALVAAVGALPLTRTLRPQLWTVLCLAVLIRVLLGTAQSRRWWLPVLFVVWANSHGGWIVGLGVLGVWLGVEGLTGSGRLGLAVVLGLACILATLVTPYGWTLWRFMGSTVHVSRPSIEEWMPLWHFGPSQCAVPLLAAVAAAWIGRRRDAHRWTRLAVLLLLACLGVRVARVAPLFVEATALILAPIVVARWHVRSVEIRTRGEKLLLTGASGLLVLAAALVLSNSLRCIPIAPGLWPDQAVVAALRQAPPGRLVVLFDWGQYALWQFGPSIRVSMDGRRETVYSDRRLAEHDAILTGSGAGIETLGVWRPEYVWLPSSSAATRTWLTLNGYRLDVDDARSFLAVRSDLPRLEGSRAAGGPACFPQ
jgi:hypothetical protein